MQLLAALLTLLLLTGCAREAPPAPEPTVPSTQLTEPSLEDACRQAAQALGDVSGLRVLVLSEAAQVSPWDYTLIPSTRAEETLLALEATEAVLSGFPDGFLPQLWEGWDSLSLCFVDAIRGSPQSGSLQNAMGLQFEDGQARYLVLALAPARELGYTLVHELSHLIDSRVTRDSHIYDSWNDLNPREFAYSLDVNADMGRFRHLLEGADRCFLDAYAMTYPEEDRARILEFAMNPGNEACFTSPAMQRKLRCICTGIREGFGLTEDGRTFLWEQYLDEHGP